MNRFLPTRREMLQASANGFGFLSLSALLAESASIARASSSPKPHFAPRAKNVILCFMDGGVSHVDSFDPKPKLAQLDGKPAGKIANAVTEGVRKWMNSPWTFRRYGRSALSVSDLFPHIASRADDLCVIRSMKAELPDHAASVLCLHTGHTRTGRPSLGSWLTYGLGSFSRNLPGFVVLGFGGIPLGGMGNYSSGFLPGSYQATLLKPDIAAVDNLTPAYQDPRTQEMQLNLVRRQGHDFAKTIGSDDAPNQAIESTIRNYELAFRMQTEVPDVLDLSKESQATKKLYGIDSPRERKRQYGIQCLRARRLVEAGVRFVEVTCPLGPGNSTSVWDQHSKLKDRHEANAFDTDQAIAGLLMDLKARGLLDTTLVLWAGEFGRTPHTARGDGRDHHPEGFTVWLAGGGVKAGTVYGATDELGMHALENVVSLHDLHATILHLLGIDHEKLTFRTGGRDFRLTDVAGSTVSKPARVVDGILA